LRFDRFVWLKEATDSSRTMIHVRFLEKGVRDLSRSADLRD